MAIKDVSQRANASPATVSRIVNGGAAVGAAKLETVLAVIDELGYHPKRLRSQPGDRPFGCQRRRRQHGLERRPRRHPPGHREGHRAPRHAHHAGTEEVAQLNLRDPLASLTRHVRQLSGDARVALASGQPRRVAFRVPVPTHAVVVIRAKR